MAFSTHTNTVLPVELVIPTIWQGMQLCAQIYDTYMCIQQGISKSQALESFPKELLDVCLQADDRLSLR